MTEEGKYIYCIINEDKNHASLRSAESCNASHYKTKSIGYVGINNREVSIVHYCSGGDISGKARYKNIAAVVSSTPVINFDRLGKKELANHIIVHQKVNEVLMKDYNIIPMTFGIIAPSVSEVLRILERAYLQFEISLRKTEGKAEFVVQVWWNPKKILEGLANKNSEIQKLKKELSLKRGVLGMPIKLRLGKLIQQEMEVQRQTFLNDIHAFLRSSSHDSTSNKLIDDDMIANHSFLIERAKELELDRKMQELGKKYEGKLKFKYIGPMPPYSFVNINLSLDNFQLVDEARRLLALPELATFNEIKKSYYKLSHQYHPDKLNGDEEQMKKITQAYSILKNYCQSYDEFAPHQNLAEGEGKIEGQQYSFKEGDVKAIILID